MHTKTIEKACFFTMFIGFGILPSLSWGGEIYSYSKGPIGHVDPGDIAGGLYLLKDEF